MATATMTTIEDTGAGQAPGVSPAPTATAVTPENRRSGGANSNIPNHNPSLSVPKGIIDELLLVCGVIGSNMPDPSNKNRLVPVTDCINWLQDLQRALRRDDDSYRPISLLIGQWRVVPQKLLPLVLGCRYDTPLILTVLKILVILTKPLSDQAKRAGKTAIDIKSKKIPESVLQEQMKLRDNALAQAELLIEYKRIFVHHASHRQSNKKEGGLLSVFVSLLAEPLSKTGSSRTDTDHLTIELVLHLFRNLLSAEPLLKGSSDKSYESAMLHQELIGLFERELVLDILLVIAQEMESRENAQYNLLLMEILHHLLRTQDPTEVARSAEPSKRLKENKTAVKNGQSATLRDSTNVPSESGSLRSRLLMEKQQRQASTSARHSHFGGTLVVSRPDGKRQYLSAALSKQSKNAAPFSNAVKRKNRKTEPFVGSGRTNSSYTSSGANLSNQGGVATKRAQMALHTFCTKFVEKCYGPVMKSLKNEFRRESVRLEEGDKVVFFRIVWFFCQWWRASQTHNLTAGRKENGNTISSAVGQLIFTMDVFTFNLVLNSTDVFFQHKKYPQLSQTVALYTEMVHLLQSMYASNDPTEKVMALGLMDRLFYSNEPLDRLPKLLSKWAPGIYTREYLCDLVSLVHVTLKLLDANAKECVQGTDNSIGKNESKKQKNDVVSRMRETAADFDVSSYVQRKIISNQVVFMYTHLLSQYAVNSVQINHQIVAFFSRLCKFTIVMSPDEDEADAMSNLLASNAVTLEPMLFNIQLLMVLSQILNDERIRHNKEYSSLLSFAAAIMRHFARAAETNPMLHVEALFRHPAPHRFCELSTNMYVNEELRMMAERELLLEEQSRAQPEMEYQYEGDGDDEVEFDDEKEDNTSLNGTNEEAHRPPLGAAADDEEEETEWFEKETSGSEKSNAQKDTENDESIEKNEDMSRTTSSGDEKDEEDVSTGGQEVQNSSPSKRSRREEDSNTDKEDVLADDTSDASPTQTKSKKRLRRTTQVDDDDDADDDDSEVEFDSPFEGTNSSRLVFDEDDED